MRQQIDACTSRGNVGIGRSLGGLGMNKISAPFKVMVMNLGVTIHGSIKLT